MQHRERYIAYIWKDVKALARDENIEHGALYDSAAARHNVVRNRAGAAEQNQDFSSANRKACKGIKVVVSRVQAKSIL